MGVAPGWRPRPLSPMLPPLSSGLLYPPRLSWLDEYISRAPGELAGAKPRAVAAGDVGVPNAVAAGF